jgi:hypothetical protein
MPPVSAAGQGAAGCRLAGGWGGGLEEREREREGVEGV